MRAVDRGIGRVLQAIEAGGHTENTLVVYLQDNGGCAEGYGRRDNADREKDFDFEPLGKDGLQTKIWPPMQTRDGRWVRTGPETMPGAEDTFKAISNAYEVLSDPQKKQIYDTYGEDGLKNFGGMGGGPGGPGMDFTNPFDLFESFFGGAGMGGGGMGGRAARANRPTQGDDERYDLYIDFLDAIFGCEREVSGARGCGALSSPARAPPHRYPQRRSDGNLARGRVRRVDPPLRGDLARASSRPGRLRVRGLRAADAVRDHLRHR